MSIIQQYQICFLGRRYHDWRMCGNDKLNLLKSCTERTNNIPLPLRMQMHINFINQHNPPDLCPIPEFRVQKVEESPTALICIRTSSFTIFLVFTPSTFTNNPPRAAAIPSSTEVLPAPLSPINWPLLLQSLCPFSNRSEPDCCMSLIFLIFYKLQLFFIKHKIVRQIVIVTLAEIPFIAYISIFPEHYSIIFCQISSFHSKAHISSRYVGFKWHPPICPKHICHTTRTIG